MSNCGHSWRCLALPTHRLRYYDLDSAERVFCGIAGQRALMNSSLLAVNCVVLVSAKIAAVIFAPSRMRSGETCWI